MSKGYMYGVAAFAAIGGLLFGYDIGVISGVFEVDDFIAQFTDRAAFEAGAIIDVPGWKKGLITSMLTLGCFIGSLFSGWFADRFGRKYSILLASVIFCLGAALQTAAYDLGLMIPGRLIAGLSIGILSMVVPLYQSEISDPTVRGRLISFQQWAITIGIAVSFWINYGCKISLTGPIAWRLPLGLQIVPAFLLGVGSIFAPFSPRWLIDHSREAEGLKVLAKLRSGGDESNPAVIEEYNEIKAQADIDRAQQARSYLELLRGNIRRRTLLGVFIQAFQQLTGINSVMYYAPAIFQQAGFDRTGGLLATAINGIVNMLSTIPAILFVDKWGRRKTLMYGAVVMGIGMTIAGAMIAGFGTNVFDEKTGTYRVDMGNNIGASYTVIVFIYIFVAGFAFSWGPIAWIYPAEIFPMRVRSKGTSITTASNWLFNYIVGLVSPILMESITWGLYIIFAAFCVIMAVSIYWWYPETKGLSLEDMDVIFADGVNPRNPQIETKNTTADDAFKS
ncbi:general substrate transporter [Neoconidiobolus thromboides FSU 785]|nr:general substrate transporter [Neoconidiobolus thromboides FSU 785]